MVDEARFTPGPWWVDAERAGGGMARHVRAGTGKFAIAKLHGDPRPAIENEANAALIAAAPTLYAALNYARNLIGLDEIIDAALASARNQQEG